MLRDYNMPYNFACNLQDWVLKKEMNSRIKKIVFMYKLIFVPVEIKLINYRWLSNMWYIHKAEEGGILGLESLHVKCLLNHECDTC